ncbi:MAG: hypothetical protein ACRDQ7_08845 [Haloechinothrix sp.]
MITWAEDVDAGLDRAVLADMMRSLARFTDHDFPTEPERVAELRAYFTSWANELDTPQQT